MEAGNRCFNENVPEETNRRLVDHVADFNLVYTEHARRNLLAEGLHPRRVMLTGSPMREVLDFNLASINASDIVDRLGLQRGGYLLVSAHREENVDSPQRLRALLHCLVAARDECQVPVLVSTHPRTRKRLEALPDEVAMEGIEFQEPFGFHDYVRLPRARPASRASSATSTSRCTASSSPGSPCRTATAASTATRRASPRSPASRRTSCPTG